MVKAPRPCRRTNSAAACSVKLALTVRDIGLGVGPGINPSVGLGVGPRRSINSIPLRISDNVFIGQSLLNSCSRAATVMIEASSNFGFEEKAEHI